MRVRAIDVPYLSEKKRFYEFDSTNARAFTHVSPSVSSYDIFVFFYANFTLEYSHSLRRTSFVRYLLFTRDEILSSFSFFSFFSVLYAGISDVYYVSL